MIKEVINNSFNFVLMIVFLIFGFYLLQDFIENKLLLLPLVLIVAFLGYYLGFLLQNKSFKNKISVLSISIITYLIFGWALISHNKEAKEINRFIGSWKSITKDNVNFTIVIKENDSAFIAMSPNYYKKKFKVKFVKNCFYFYGNDELSDIQWCPISVNKNEFYFCEGNDTLYFHRTSSEAEN